eukprot:gb/GFBE01053846.1/.p1 GENE.gb/GFBE01053846.1/~~gb/GFBE01053846.1/.p1  ORF type:complete len:394 (+),score=81.91 gb/GFBE01053846.1/:1-1182(+)
MGFFATMLRATALLLLLANGEDAAGSGPLLRSETKHASRASLSQAAARSLAVSATAEVSKFAGSSTHSNGRTHQARGRGGHEQKAHSSGTKGSRTTAKVSSQSPRNLLQADEEDAQEPKIDTYVINLDTRVDRCRCMAAQLSSAPQAVYRHRAEPSSECSELKSDARSLYGKRNHTPEKSLFCTNYKVWKRARESDAEFVMILEDDAVLAPDFWSSVMSFLKECNDFDYLSVDSWKGSGDIRTLHKEQVSGHCPKSSDARFLQMFRPDPTAEAHGRVWALDYWGTQVQLIRRSYLDTMIAKAEQHGMGPLDVWWMRHLNEGKSFSWQPGIAIQADRSQEFKMGRAEKDCSASVQRSDIGALVESSQPRLVCPAGPVSALEVRRARLHSRTRRK